MGSWKIFLLEIKQQSQRNEKKACYSSNDQGGLRDIKAVLFQYQGRLSSLQAGESFLARLAKEDSMSMVRVDAFILLVQLRIIYTFFIYA